MVYKALYRKYRPATFEGLVGQEHISKTLINAIKNNKIAHAYLFSGPRGTGKTSVAKIFAKAVNCESTDKRPCGVCHNCQDITNSIHPDIVEIDAASNNGVDEIRDLIEKVKYTPIAGKYKVYIIDEVHMLSSGAFNALLKTLEEPPAHVIFILATTETHKVIPTILSRCQRYNFTKITITDLEKKLLEVVDAEKIRCDDGVLRQISLLADGGMRDGLSILDQCIAYAKNDIKLSDVNDIYGIATSDERMGILKNAILGNINEVLIYTRTLNEKGTDIKRLTSDLMDMIKETVVYSRTKEKSLLSKIVEKEANEILDLSTSKKLLDMLSAMMDTYEKYRNSSNILSYFEICLLKLNEINKEPEITTQYIAKDISTTKQTQKETQNTQTQPEQQKAPIRKEQNSINDNIYFSILFYGERDKRIEYEKKYLSISEYTTDLTWASYANKLINSKLIAVSDNILLIEVEFAPLANELNEEVHTEKLCNFLKLIFNNEYKCYFISNQRYKTLLEDFKKRYTKKEKFEKFVYTFEKKEEENQVLINPLARVNDLFNNNVIEKEVVSNVSNIS